LVLSRFEHDKPHHLTDSNRLHHSNLAQTTTSILTTIKSHLDGWETISHNDTSQTQHHKGWKDFYDIHDLLSPPLSRGPAEAKRPSPPPSPVRACSPVRPRGLPKPHRFPSSQGLGHAKLTSCHRLPATELTPCSHLCRLCLVPRSCLPQTPRQRPTSFLRTATTESKWRIYPQRDSS
jgi:hypothetical protein